MRTIISGLALIAIAIGGVFYGTYSTLDPCRALAQEMAEDTIGNLAERPMRMLTSQYSTGECVEGLWDRWTDFSD
ncbi:MAG: hypothetical protein RLO08_08125 [Parvibaculaceae bacterium]